MERVYRKVSFVLSTKSNVTMILLPFLATMSNEFFVKFCAFDKVERNLTCSICFHFVERTKFHLTLLPKPATMLPKTAKCQSKLDLVERIVQHVAFNKVASTLLLVWTGLKITTRLRVTDWHF